MLMPMLPMRILLVLIGISLGAVVMIPATLNGMAAYPLSIAVLLAGHDLHQRQRRHLSARWCTAGTR